MIFCAHTPSTGNRYIISANDQEEAESILRHQFGPDEAFEFEDPEEVLCNQYDMLAELATV